MKFIKSAEVFLLALSYKIPLGLFVIVGSFLEEIIAPIPSPLVMMTAGTIAKAQGRSFWYLMLIGVIAAASKTIGCFIFYFIADKAEDILTTRFGKLIGFSHSEIEKIGELFSGKPKDDLILAGIRAIPIMPTTPVSLACGFIKMKLSTYLRSTFIGCYIRGMLFGFIGYSGLSILESSVEGINSLESVMNVVLVLLVAGFLGFVYFKRGKIDLHKILKKKSRLVNN